MTKRKTIYDRADRFALNNTPGLATLGHDKWTELVEHVRFGYMAGVRAERRRKGKNEVQK